MSQPDSSHEPRMYVRFAAMIVTSTTVMFVLTYSNTDDADHIRYSQERLSSSTTSST